MKNKILSFILIIALIFTSFIITSCSDDNKESDELNPHSEHLFGEWQVKSSNCLEGGTKTRTCIVGGETEKEELPPFPHVYSEKGVCVVCGAREENQ